jgi:hypothetical protein
MAKRRRAVTDPTERARLKARFEADARTSTRDDVVTASLPSAQSDGTEQGHEKSTVNRLLRGCADRRALIFTFASVAGIALLVAVAIGARSDDAQADAAENRPTPSAVSTLPSVVAAPQPPPVPSATPRATLQTAERPLVPNAREPVRTKDVRRVEPAPSASAAPAATGFPERAPANPYAE